MILNHLTGTRASNLFRNRLKGESFPSKACNDFCHFVNVRNYFLLKRVTGYWNELINSHVNAKNINSFKAGLDSITLLAAKVYKAKAYAIKLTLFSVICRYMVS